MRIRRWRARRRELEEKKNAFMPDAAPNADLAQLDGAYIPFLQTWFQSSPSSFAGIHFWTFQFLHALVDQGSFHFYPRFNCVADYILLSSWEL